MAKIKHEKAIELEEQVCRLFNCERGGVSGMADADNYENNPICAAYMVVSYIYAQGLAFNDRQFDEFLYKYECIFLDDSYEYDLDKETNKYVSEISSIVESFIK